MGNGKKKSGGKKASQKKKIEKGPCGDVVNSKACDKARANNASHCANCHHNTK